MGKIIHLVLALVAVAHVQADRNAASSGRDWSGEFVGGDSGMKGGIGGLPQAGSYGNGDHDDHGMGGLPHAGTHGSSDHDDSYTSIAGIFGNGGVGPGTNAAGTGTDTGSGESGFSGSGGSGSSGDGDITDLSGNGGSGSGLSSGDHDGGDGDDGDDHPHLINKKDCAKGCAECFFGLCNRCKKGYQKTAFMTCIKKKTKRRGCRGIPHCQVCPRFSFLRTCSRCQKDWFKHQGQFHFKARCVKKCPRGYQSIIDSKKGSYCKKVLPKCPLMPNCEKCPKANTCTKCAKNLLVLDNIPFVKSRCVRRCPRGFKNVLTNGVRKCQVEEGCPDQYCGVCKKGWYKLNYKGKRCHKQCPVGFYRVGNSFCRRCKRGCTKCSSMFKCEACGKRLSLFTTTSWGSVTSTRCLARCPRGFKKELIRGKGSVCSQVCFVANCQRCPRDGHNGLHHHCDSCKPGYHLLHEIYDKCVSQCPKGYHPEKVHIGTICRKGSHPTTPASEITTTEPETTTVEPETSTTVEPETTTMEPETTTVANDLTTTNSEFTTSEPETTTTQEPEFTTAVLETTTRPLPGWSDPAYADEP